MRAGVEPGLARAHVVDRVELVEIEVVHVLADELAQDHTFHPAPLGERGVGDGAHQPCAAAAVHQDVAAAGNLGAELTRGHEEAGIGAFARDAEDRDLHPEVPELPCLRPRRRRRGRSSLLRSGGRRAGSELPLGGVSVTRTSGLCSRM